jgi:hypothetical protein
VCQGRDLRVIVIDKLVSRVYAKLWWRRVVRVFVLSHSFASLICYDKDRKRSLYRSNGQKTEREWDESKADRVRIGSDGSTADRER